MQHDQHDTADGESVVLGIFPVQSLAEDCVMQLREEGFRNVDISVLLPIPREQAIEVLSRGVELGGALGWLAQPAVAAIPGLGSFITAGPLLSTIAGPGVAGALGGISAVFANIGIPEYEARRYETLLKDGGCMVSVVCEDEERSRIAPRLFKVNGGKNVLKTGDLHDTERPFTAVIRHPVY